MIVYTVTGSAYIGDYFARAVQQELLHTAKTGQSAVKGPVKGTMTAKTGQNAVKGPVKGTITAV